ncbi:MAG: response regulator [Actinomycetota bacterium]|nr:response regulator [Actinomycetota bacterium]
MRSLDVLLIEDSNDDVELFLAAASTALTDHLVTKSTGEEAIEYLLDQPDGSVDLIILDLRLPGMDGNQVLDVLRSDQTLRTIPVIIMSTSFTEQDVVNAYLRSANAFVVKPLGLDELRAALRSIEAFWSSTARLPSLGTGFTRPSLGLGGPAPAW